MKKLCILLLPLLCSLLLASCNTEQHEHTYHYICTEEVHQRVYTCTCPSADIAELHADTDADGRCDVCGYSMRVAIPEAAIRPSTAPKNTDA
jgi:hypothetical protein